MTIAPVRSCQFPQDLEAAANALDQELGDRIIANDALLTAAEETVAAVDSQLAQGFDILERVLGLGDGSSNIKTGADVSEQFGLPEDKPTASMDEKQLANYGILVHDDVMYAPGRMGTEKAIDNIGVLRRLFIASGRDLTRTKAFLQAKRTLFVYNKLHIAVAPAKVPGNKAYTLTEIKTIYSLPHLTKNDISINEDFTTSILIRTYLDSDISLAEVKRRYNLEDHEIITSVFHFDVADNSSNSITRYTSYGFSGALLNDIIAGEETTTATVLSITANKMSAAATIGQIDLINQRYEALDSNYKKEVAKSKLTSDVEVLQKTHSQSIALSLFQVTVIKDREVLEKLHAKHSDTQIERLLNERDDITGLFFEPTDEQLIKLLSNALNSAVPGSTVGSNKFLNTSTTLPIDQSVLMSMSGDLYDARRIIITPLTKYTMRETRRNLSEYIGKTPNQAAVTSTSSTSSIIFQGQPSVATPSALATDRINTDKTLGMEDRLSEVQDAFKSLYDLYPPSVAKPLAEIINIVAKLFEKAMKGLQTLINKAKNLILPLKKRLDAFMSRHLSLTGSGKFETSLLKCAINFDVSLSFGLLDELLKFFNNIGALLAKFLSSLAQWVGDLFEKLLCLPINLINAFLGKVSTALPSSCQIPRVKLSDAMVKALTRLRAVGDMNFLMLQAFSRDLIKYKLSVTAASEKLKQFKNGALCNTSQVSNFYNASILNLGGSVPNVFGA